MTSKARRGKGRAVEREIPAHKDRYEQKQLPTLLARLVKKYSQDTSDSGDKG